MSINSIINSESKILSRILNSNQCFRAEEEGGKKKEKKKRTLEEQTNVNTNYFKIAKHDYAIKTTGNLVWCRVIPIYNQ